MAKKKLKLILITVLCAVLVTAGTTVALLSSIAGPVENVFTIGDIELSLSETTGTSYQLIPGSVIKKDPVVKVGSGSEDCWLFIKVTKTKDFDDYVTCRVADGWTHLNGDVYYRSVAKTSVDEKFQILADDVITVKDDLTEEIMSSITVAPKITFKAYAIQSYSIGSPNDAWYQILEAVTE